MNNPWNKREKILQQDTRKDFIEKRNNQSKRFGKKRLFELFNTAYFDLNDMSFSDNFNMIFGSRIVNKLKGDMYIDYFKKTTYKELRSLFGKFVNVMNKTSIDIYKDFVEPNSTIQTTPNIQKSNQCIQLSLFDEFEKIDDRGDAKKEDLLVSDASVSADEYAFAREKKSQSQKTKSDEIDLDALYAPDPDEPRWNK